MNEREQVSGRKDVPVAWIAANWKTTFDLSTTKALN